MKQKIRIGCGAGFSGDRLDPSLILAEKGDLDYLVLECLAERTIALAQKRKQKDPTQGYDPLLERRMGALLPLLVKNKIRLISNMGAANPLAGAQKVVEIAQKQGVNIKIAAVLGDDVFSTIRVGDWGLGIEPSVIVSANAYLGVEGILEALEKDAQIIITGRVSDPSLFLAPMMYEFGWQNDDFNILGKGTVIGHLLECAGHITGGYFADPIAKPVPDLESLGHPFADIFPDGSAVISKVEGTGGVVNLQTSKEQLLYEVVNPHAYLTPDVAADFTTVKLTQITDNQILVTGGTGKNKPQQYKVSVGYKAFWLGEGEISYAGQNALERAELAGEILKKRLQSQFSDLRIDLIGLNSMHRAQLNPQPPIPNPQSDTPSVKPYEIRLRAAATASTQIEAQLIGEEVEALYTNGPAGGGGVRKYTNEVLGIVSTYIDRGEVVPMIYLFES